MGKYQDGLKADFEAYCASRIANLTSPPIELERRDGEMADDEPDYSDIDALDWSDLNDEADSINIITGEVEK